MSFDYDDMAATAADLLDEFGAIVTLKRTTPGGYDPTNGGPGAGSTQTWDGPGVKLEYLQKDIDGTLIKQGDQRVYLSVLGVAEPLTGDKITIGGQDWSVIKSRTLAPAGINVLFDVQVRRG